MIFRKKLENCFFRKKQADLIPYPTNLFGGKSMLIAIAPPNKFGEYDFTIIYIALLSLFFASCKEKPREISTGFYHWKTELNISDFEKAYLDSCLTQKMYIRLFDVDWDETARFPTPLATVMAKNEGFSFLNPRVKVVPTVFITNKTFIQLHENQIDTLTKLIFEKINTTFKAIKSQNTEGVAFSEIQMDCDWTESTRDKYFLFLQKLKSISSIKTSTTIRLHQIKDRHIMGIPPVERGMLMAYNMGDLDNPKGQNSILDIGILKNYIKNLKSYPLSLDIALPIFSWGVVLRDGEAVKIINNLSLQDFLSIDDEGRSLGIVPKTNNLFTFEKNMYFKGHYLYKDDEIRIEDTPLSILTHAAEILQQNLKSENRTISFYHTDFQLFSRYRYEAIQDIVHRFK
jgi:hypothetical protein